MRYRRPISATTDISRNAIWQRNQTANEVNTRDWFGENHSREFRNALPLRTIWTDQNAKFTESCRCPNRVRLSLAESEFCSC